MNFGELIAKGGALFLRKKLSAVQAVYDAAPASEKAAFQSSVSGYAALPFSRTIDLTHPNAVMDQTLYVDGAAFSVADGAVTCARTYVRLISSGAAVPSFGVFREHSSSDGWIATLNTVNNVLFFFDGVSYFYSISHAVPAEVVVAAGGEVPIIWTTYSGASVNNSTGRIQSLSGSPAGGQASLGISTAAPFDIRITSDNRAAAFAWVVGLESSPSTDFGWSSPANAPGRFSPTAILGLYAINANVYRISQTEVDVMTQTAADPMYSSIRNVGANLVVSNSVDGITYIDQYVAVGALTGIPTVYVKALAAAPEAGRHVIVTRIGG